MTGRDRLGGCLRGAHALEDLPQRRTVPWLSGVFALKHVFEPVSEAVHRLEKADALLIQEDGKPVGVVTRQDLLAYLATR